MDEAAATVVRAFEGALLDRVIERTRALDPEPQLDDDTTRQFVHGFVAIVREAADGSSRDGRDLLTASAAGVSVEQGRTPGSVAQSLVRFGVVVGDELGRELDPASARAATDWLAAFLATWTSELVGAMEEAR